AGGPGDGPATSPTPARSTGTTPCHPSVPPSAVPSVVPRYSCPAGTARVVDPWAFNRRELSFRLAPRQGLLVGKGRRWRRGRLGKGASDLRRDGQDEHPSRAADVTGAPGSGVS